MPRRGKAWSPEDVVRLGCIYAEGGMPAALAAFPDRSHTALSAKCASEGFRRDPAAPKIRGNRHRRHTPTPPTNAVKAAQSPPVAAVREQRPAVAATEPRPPSRHELDPGDTEIVRRRITHAIDALAVELRCYPSNVRAALAKMMESGLTAPHRPTVKMDDIL